MYIYVIRERISGAFLPAMCITLRIKRVFVHGDPVEGGRRRECGSSSFDVTTYLPVDRPTHPYKQGLLERNRNNLYPKGLGSDRVSLGSYLPPYVELRCTYACTRVGVTWLEHFRGVRGAFCARFWGINRPRLLATTTACPPSISVFPYRPSRLGLGSKRNSEFRLD